MAFPTLFPLAQGDPFGIYPNSGSKSFLAKIRHLLMYSDGTNDTFESRFAQHPRFVLWCYNIYFRHLTLSQGDIYLKQNPQDGNLTIEKLKELIKNPIKDNNVIKNMKRYMANVPGSPSYWSNVRNQLNAIIETKGPPHFFITLSFADRFSLFKCFSDYLTQFHI